MSRDNRELGVSGMIASVHGDADDNNASRDNSGDDDLPASNERRTRRLRIDRSGLRRPSERYSEGTVLGIRVTCRSLPSPKTTESPENHSSSPWIILVNRLDN